jgi:hypothetical protein
MKIRLLVVSVVALSALAMPSPAFGVYVEHPTIHEREAFENTQSFLAKKYSGWRRREAGYIDCRPGRINRYTWSCAVGWLAGSNCWQGRVRVENEYKEDGVVYYNVRFRARRC